MFLGKKTLLKIWLNLGLNLTVFPGTELEACKLENNIVSEQPHMVLAK